MTDRSRYLQSSPYEADNGSLVGLDPRSVPRADLRALTRLGTPTSPIKAIRAFCVECSGNNAAEARKCVRFKCPLWPFRMGTNVFHARAGGSDA